MTCAPWLRMPRTARCVRRSLPFVTALLMFVAPALEAVAQEVSFEERLLATIPKELDESNNWRFNLGPTHGLYLLGLGDRWQPVFSRDGRHSAYLARRDGRAVAVVDGKEGPPFDAIYDFVFSADGRRFAYVGRNGKELDASRWIMVIDHQAGSDFDDVGIPVFSPDGARLLHTARQVTSGRMRAVLVDNGRIVAEHDWLGDIAFSPDGKTLAIATGRLVGDSLRCSMTVGEKAGPEFLWVGFPTWSGDGKHFAYATRQATRRQRTLRIPPGYSRAESKSAAMTQSTGIKLSLNGYATMQTTQMLWTYVLRDGEVVLDAPHIVALRFRGDRVVAIEGGIAPELSGGFYEGKNIFGGNRVFVEGKSATEYDQVGLPTVSADGQHIAYGAQNWPTGLHNFQALLVVDSQETKLNRGLTAGVMGVPYVPSGIGHFYAARVGSRDYAGIDRSRLFLRLESLFRLASPPLSFSLDAQRVAYTDFNVVHIGEQKSDRFDWAGPPVFSPDGSKVAFGARKGRELWWKVMDVK